MKGQVSLDFLLAVSIALIVATGLVTLGSDIADMQAKAGIRRQLENAGTGLANVISYSAILNDAEAGDATVTYSIPKIAVLGEAGKQECRIVIEEENLRLSYELIDLEAGTTETIMVEVPFVAPERMTLSPALTAGNEGKCGGTVTITR